jgi:hypothetical protein
MNKIKINKKQMKQLLTLVEKGTASEKKALLSFMEQHILPFHIIQLEQSQDKVIQQYAQMRIKKLYTINKISLEEEFAKRVELPLEEIEEWGEASEAEFSYYKRDAEKVIAGVTCDFASDETEGLELIKHNITLGLTSSCAYIRSLAEIHFKKKA